MNATFALGATAPVTPVAEAVLAPGLSDGPRPLFAQVLGQAPAADGEPPDGREALDAALSPWLMALDSQQAPALPFTQPFSRLLGAAARQAQGEDEGAAPWRDADAAGDARHPLAPHALAGPVASARPAGADAGPCPPQALAAASPADAAGGAPATAVSPARSPADAAVARALPPELALALAAPRARETAPASPDAFAAAFHANAGPSGGEAIEPVVRLDPARSELWQRPLAQALGDRLQWQATQGVDQARIRLDPPALGRIEIVVRQEGAQLQVQLTASSPEVARQLQHMGEGLRQDLGQRQGQGQGVQVQVQVHEGGAQADARGQPRQGQPAREEAEPGQALRSEHRAGQAFTLA